MQLPVTVETKGIRVLTTKQLAEEYGTTANTIKVNFTRNRSRFVDGKHYISLAGDDLKAFKNQVTQCNLVDGRTSHLYLWTEKGALLHAKSLNTDKAWEVYDYLVDFYFRVKEDTKPAPKIYRELREAALAEKKPVSKPNTKTVVDVPENPKILNAIQKIEDDLICMNVLLEDCKKYLSENEYKERRKAAAAVVHIIINDWNILFDLQPKMIQKQY